MVILLTSVAEQELELETDFFRRTGTRNRTAIPPYISWGRMLGNFFTKFEFLVDLNIFGMFHLILRWSLPTLSNFDRFHMGRPSYQVWPRGQH